MFDSPDLTPCCVGLFVIFSGVFVYLLSSHIRSWIEKKTGKEITGWLSIIFLYSFLVAPIICLASYALENYILIPSPWFEPTSKNIVGKWELTADETEFIQNNYGIPVIAHELIFNQDGTFTINNLPSIRGVSGSTNKSGNAKYLSGSGTWHLGKGSGTERPEWAIYAQFQKIDGLPNNRSISFEFKGHLPPYTLSTFIDMVYFFHKK